jgi:protoporphyrinogen oxidase
MMDPAPPAEVLRAASAIRFRGMILIYLVLEQDQFTEYDAHYFPEISIPISRMSEPKNYSASTEPRGRTILCAELPSDPGQPEWALSDEDLGKQMCSWLANVGLPVRAPVKSVITRRLRFAYPVYDRDYESHFRIMDDWVSGIDGLLTFGRQGLFAHDNTHHAMTMAYAAAGCLGPDGRFDRKRWAEYREEFKSHVVED